MQCTFKSDHGRFVSAEDGGGHVGETIDGRPTGLMTATRETAGAWETITVEPVDGEPGVVGLISCDYGGRVACCENAEADGAANRPGIVVFNRDAIGAWEKFKIHDLDGDGVRVAFESVARPGWFIKAWGDGHISLDQPYANDAPTTTPGGYETFVADPPLRTVVAARIVGQLRTTVQGYADDSGPVLPIGIHLGDLFSVFTRDTTRALDTLAACRDAGYALLQFWLNLGSLGGDYWAGREIGPEITPDYWGQLARFSDALDAHGIRGIYCTGDYTLRSMSHKDFARTLGETLRARDTGALVIAGNEAWQTGASSIETLQEFIDAFKAACPDVPITTTSPPTEETDEIAEWCDGDYYNIHGWRDGEDHDRIRHIFSVPWEGHPPAKCGYQDEPTGPGDEVSVKAFHCYNGRDVDAMHLCALAAQSLMTDQGFNFFCSDGVKLDTVASLTAWQGFGEVARVPSMLPRDLMSWPFGWHFGDSQSAHRVFKPHHGNAVRFDHRVSHDGRMVGLLYGDQGGAAISCTQACDCEVVEFNGNVVIAMRRFNIGDLMSVDFVRSQGGQPGRTCLLVRGRLANVAQMSASFWKPRPDRRRRRACCC